MDRNIKRRRSKERLVTHEWLTSVLSYTKSTGIFRWKIPPGPPSKAEVGDVAGCIDPNGYVIICLTKRGHFKAHRLAWFYVTGAWPENFVDHRNGTRHDNRFRNLREASRTSNGENQRKAHTGNPSGYLGVSLTEYGRYNARIRINGKLKSLGTYDDPIVAHKVYLKAKRQSHVGNTL